MSLQARVGRKVRGRDFGGISLGTGLRAGKVDGMPQGRKEAW